MDFHHRKCVLAGAYSVEDEEVLQSYYQMGKVHWVGLIGGMYQIFCMGVAKLMSMDHFSGFMGIRYIRIFSLWILKELQLIWVQLQLIWVWFFECALGHVDQIHIYICWHMWCWSSCAGIIGIAVRYTHIVYVIIHIFLSWASVSALDIKKNFSHIDYIHICRYNIYTYIILNRYLYIYIYILHAYRNICDSLGGLSASDLFVLLR